MIIDTQCYNYVNCTHHCTRLQVSPPESVKPRYYHSTTATSLGPGLTEVLMFAGRRKRLIGDDIAETTILRFGEELQEYYVAVNLANS